MERITIVTAGQAQGNPGPAAIGVQVFDAEGVVLYENAEFIGNATSDFAAYHAVLCGLQIAKEILVEKTTEIQFEVTLGNELVAQQLSGKTQIKEPGLVPFFIEIHNMRVSSFPHIKFVLQAIESSERIDQLVKEALTVA